MGRVWNRHLRNLFEYGNDLDKGIATVCELYLFPVIWAPLSSMQANAARTPSSPTCRALASCISHGVSLYLCYPTFCRSYLYYLHTSLKHPITTLLLAFSRPRRSAMSFQRRGWACVNGVRSEPTTHKLRVQAFDATSRLLSAWGWIYGSGEGHGMANGSSGGLLGKEGVGRRDTASSRWWRWEGGMCSADELPSFINTKRCSWRQVAGTEVGVRDGKHITRR
jgi:hypothetical protein